MRIKGHDLDVNVRTELEAFEGRFNIIKEKDNKFIATSPFRDEAHPSFAVNLETGTYIDSGCLDEHWKKGNFIRLLSYLRCETYEDTEEYLWQTYNMALDDVDALELDFSELEKVPNHRMWSLSALQQFAYRCDYLSGRKVSEQVQKAFMTGYSPSSKAIVLPILDKHGDIVSFKYRRIDSKIFWYDKEGQPIKQHLYGMHFIHKMNCKTAYICEGEVDCLTLWSAGIPAIATFGASLSEKQSHLIINSPIEKLVIAGDNDDVGRAFAKKLENQFIDIMEVEQLILPTGFKDVNDLPVGKWSILKNTVPSIPSFL